MAENTTTVQEDDIADVNLLDQPIGGPATTVDEPSKPADDKPNDGAGTQDKPADDAKPAAKPDAKGTEAKDQPAKPDSQDKPAADDKKTAQDDQKGEDQKPAEGDKPAEGQEQKTPEQLREEQQSRARMEYQNRQRTRQEIAQQLDQGFGPKTQEELEEEGLDPADAKIEALRQEMTYKETRAQVAELNAGMQAEAVNALNDFSIYNPNSQDYDEAFTDEVSAAYKQAARLQTVEVGKDPQGKPIEVIINADLPLYDFYQRMAGIYSRGTSRGNQQGQAEMQEMMSRTENPGGSSSTQGGNLLEDLEERLGNVVIT